MKLYVVPGSYTSKRLEIMLHELGRPFERVVLDLAKGDNRTPAYLAKNPMGKVPTLEEDDGFVLWESTAACLYLAEGSPLAPPTEARGRADALRWMFFVAGHVDPPVFGLFRERTLKPRVMKKEPEPKVVEQLEADLGRYLPILDQHLQGREWMLGETFGVLDVVLGPTMETASKVGVELGGQVRGWLERMRGREAWGKVYGS